MNAQVDLINTSILKSLSIAIRTKRYKNAAEWATYNRILPPENAEPGPFDVNRTPYFLPIYDAAENPKIERIVIAMGTQMGKSEFLFNVLGHVYDTTPVPCIYVAPTDFLASSISRDRFSKMLKSSPSLRQKVTKNDSQEKIINGVRLGFAYATSAAQLCSHPACIVVLDERDRMLDDVDGEGDPLLLMEARNSTYINHKKRKSIVTSTMTTFDDSATWRLLKDGTHYEWHLPCPSCFQFFKPCLTNFDYLRGVMVCEHCNKFIDDNDRLKILPYGKYVSSKDEEFLNTTKIASYWVSGLCSPWRTLKDMAVSYSQAYNENNANVLQAVINTIFGECFKIRGESPSIQKIMELRHDRPRGMIPADYLCMVCGVDVQKDCLYYVVRIFRKDHASEQVDFGVLSGDTDYEDVWIKLSEILKMYPIHLVAIDSGYRPNYVYNFCRQYGGNVVPVRGKSRGITVPIQSSFIDINFKTSKNKRSGLKLFIFDDSYFKSALYGAINSGKQWFCCNDVTEEYCRQVTAESYGRTKKGVMQWNMVYYANHYLDCEKICLICAEMLQISKIDESEALKSRNRVISQGVAEINAD